MTVLWWGPLKARKPGAQQSKLVLLAAETVCHSGGTESQGIHQELPGMQSGRGSEKMEGGDTEEVRVMNHEVWLNRTGNEALGGHGRPWVETRGNVQRASERQWGGIRRGRGGVPSKRQWRFRLSEAERFWGQSECPAAYRGLKIKMCWVCLDERH